jgi:hypothetical protein
MERAGIEIEMAEIEILDAKGLAQKWNVPASWILQQSRERSPDRIPHLKLGRYVRFEFGSPKLAAWLDRRRSGR